MEHSFRMSWHLVPPDAKPGERFSGFYAFFFGSRSALRGTGLFGLPPHAESVLLGHPQGVEAHWEPALEGKLQLELRLQVEGEPLEIARLEWIPERALEPRVSQAAPPAVATVAETEALLEGYEPPEAEPGKLTRPAKESLLERAASVAVVRGSFLERWRKLAHESREELQEAIALEVDTGDKQRQFFTQLDQRSNPQVFIGEEFQKYKLDVDPATKALKERILARAAQGAAGDLSRRPNLAPLPEPLCVEFSRLQIGLFRELWRDFEKDDAQLAEIDGAFEQFAAGRFTNDSVLVANGAPNSANFFMFAEFAFAAREAATVPQDEQKAWGRLLPSLVRAQAIYVEAYRPPSPGPWWWADFSLGNYDPRRPLTGAFLQDVRARYAALAKAYQDPDALLEALAVEMAKTAAAAFARELAPQAAPAHVERSYKPR
jgi:hypothetical protein